MKKAFIFLILICLTACGTGIQSTPTNVPETSTIQPIKLKISLSPTIGNTYTPEVTQTVVTSTSTPEITETIITSTPTPETTTYYDSELKFQISYPKSWSRESKGVFVGQNGYLIIKKLENYTFPDLVHVAIDFANTRYSKYRPRVYCLGFGHGCAIVMKAPDLSGHEIDKVISVIPYYYYPSRHSAKYLTVERPLEYFTLTNDSIIQDTTQFEPTHNNVPITIPTPIQMSVQGGLTIQTTPLDKFYKTDNEDVQYNNAHEIVSDYCGILAARRNQDFSMTEEDNGLITIKRRGETVYEYASWVFDGPNPWSFCTWDNSWMFETNDIVVIDGQVLNHQLGLDTIFSWHMLGDKQVYFIEKNNKFQISFAGQLVPVKYDEIRHYGCCAWHGANPRTNGSKTWFEAKRDDVWFMVVISSD
jgi:hypothetical protein